MSFQPSPHDDASSSRSGDLHARVADLTRRTDEAQRELTALRAAWNDPVALATRLLALLTAVTTAGNGGFTP